MGKTLGLFAGFGVEIEYMIVDRDTLDVRPVCDRILEAVGGLPVQEEVETGVLAWSNELVAHVVELKTAGPAPSLDGLAGAFADDVGRIDAILEPLGARLLPTGMHPWMDPATETRLWPHENNRVYRAFDRIFDCRGHGWANLQSTHLNLPFANDDEFGRLHAAIRVVLPLLPALAASSPFIDGRRAASLDERLAVYRTNCRRIPSITGDVIPEAVFTAEAYARLLDRLYADIAPHDPDAVLREEWLNARGAIARFDRGAIEIRVLDTQEHPGADLAIAHVVTRVLRALVEERWSDTDAQRALDTGALAETLSAVIRDADHAGIDATDHLAVLGLPPRPTTAGAVWASLAERVFGADALPPALRTILDHGPLARRILAATGDTPDRATLRRVYGSLADCLARGESFDA